MAERVDIPGDVWMLRKECGDGMHRLMCGRAI